MGKVWGKGKTFEMCGEWCGERKMAYLRYLDKPLIFLERETGFEILLYLILTSNKYFIPATMYPQKYPKIKKLDEKKQTYQYGKIQLFQIP